jgi:hypothetical protein
MKVATYLLLSLACGAALYAAAAVAWSMFDPQGAGRVLLFTIPIALVTMAVMGLLAALAMVAPFESKEAHHAPSKAPATTVPEIHHRHDDADDPDLGIA